MSGEFTLINTNLVNELKQLGIWNHKTLNILKQFDGSIQNLNINEPYKYPLADIFAGVFELDSADLIECAALRQKWIDQAQSLNIYLDKPSGKKLNDLYQQAWKSGLKSTYYLRTLGASQTEKNIIPNDIETFELSNKLYDILIKATSYDKNNRYSSIKEFHKEFKNAVKGSDLNERE